jgi:hypothetical protein
MATALRHEVFPRVERLDVFISLQGDLEEVAIELDESRSRITVMWPQGQSVLNSQDAMAAQPYLLELCALVLGAISMMPDTEKSLDQMVTQEEVLERALSFSFAHFASERVLGTKASSLDDLEHLRSKSYPPIDPLPDVVPQPLEQDGPSQFNEWAGNNEMPYDFETPQSHKGIRSSSIINLPLWDKAGWQGVLYAYNGAEDQQPPMLGLVLSDREAATAIFKEWNEKFGRKDVDDQIRISIIRGVKAEQEHHYRVHISKSIENDLRQGNPGQRVYNVSRINTMEPESSEGLDMFLEQFNKSGMFFLVPAVVSESGSMPDLLIEQSILSRNLYVRHAHEIGQHDPDAVAIIDSDNIVQPDEV